MGDKVSVIGDEIKGLYYEFTDWCWGAVCVWLVKGDSVSLVRCEVVGMYLVLHVGVVITDTWCSILGR